MFSLQLFRQEIISPGQDTFEKSRLLQFLGLRADVYDPFFRVIYLFHFVQTFLGRGPISVTSSWWQVFLYFTGGAKEMTSRPCRVWKYNPDRTVMTKEFLLGNIRVYENDVWRPCFLSSCSSCLLPPAHQPFSDVSNSLLTCEPPPNPPSFFFLFWM